MCFLSDRSFLQQTKSVKGGVMLKKIVSFFLCMVLLNQPVWAEEMPDFAEIVKANANAVVQIAAGDSTQMLAPELGSGFVISEDGYILTNCHVVQNAGQISVKFKDQRVLVATLIGLDKATDLALLKVTASGLTKVKIGSVASLEQADWVMAIGAPFGFEQSVTKGIVSAKNRVVSKEGYVPFIQTDVPINQGSSGGPLFNSKGLVVGINSWIYSKGEGGYQGLSFAIPIDLAMDVVARLKSKGKVLRGWLGIKTQEVPLELAKSFTMPKAYGALISEIAPASPAQKSGLKVGDIVISFNRQSVENAATFPSRVGIAAAEGRISFEVIRQGEKKIIEVKFIPMPGS